jgi:hypothetical protein
MKDGCPQFAPIRHFSILLDLVDAAMTGLRGAR